MDAAHLALAAEGATCALAGLLAVSAIPSLFRALPPHAASAAFPAIVRRPLLAALASALVATASRAPVPGGAPGATPALLLDLLAAALLAAGVLVAGAFSAARASALREPAPGARVDGDAILRSHRLVGALRSVAGLAALAALIAVLSEL